MANEFKHKDPGTALTQAEYIGACGDIHIFASQATGDILYADSSTVLKRLARACSGSQMLQIASCKPAWTATPSLGSTSWANMNHAHAGSTSGGTLTTVGVLNAGSINCGFGNIDTGSSTITTTGTITGGALTTGGAVTAGAASTISIDADSEFIGLKLTNQSDAADTTGFVTLAFDLEDTGGTAVDAAKISVKKEASFTATASTQDSKMEFQLSENGTLAEKMTLSSAGALSIDGALSIGGSQVLSGSILATAVKLNNANWCGADLAVANGGTNLSVYAVGDVVYASGTTTLAKLTKPGSPSGQVLTFAACASAPSWVAAAGGVNEQLFTSTAACGWTKPTSGTVVYMEVYGAGGGGARGESAGASGGGGGAATFAMYDLSSMPCALSITIGGGGAKGTTGTGYIGAAGGVTSVIGTGVKVYAYGGGGTPRPCGANSGGGGGGGGGSVGINGDRSAAVDGGEPQPMGGGKGGFNSAGGAADWGGGGGAGARAASLTTGHAGGGSLHGGGGGGGGDRSGSQGGAGGAGGGQGGAIGGGSAGANSGAVAVDGPTRTHGAGCGGGGDSHSNQGGGGDGGAPGGGGGGGTYTNSDGGDGARGEVRIWTW